MKGLRTRTRFETEAKGANPLHAWPFRLNLGLHWEYTGSILGLHWSYNRRGQNLLRKFIQLVPNYVQSIDHKL